HLHVALSEMTPLEYICFCREGAQRAAPLQLSTFVDERPHSRREASGPQNGPELQRTRFDRAREDVEILRLPLSGSLRMTALEYICFCREGAQRAAPLHIDCSGRRKSS